LGLHVVAFQLSLFPWRPDADERQMGQAERDNRTADQWLKSIIGYLEWRAGECWRRLSCREQRFSPDRLEYLAAIRTISDLRYSSPLQPSLVLPDLFPSPSPSSLELKLRLKSRAWLVDELLRTDPRYTDRKLLMRLQPKKLAHMLAAATPVTARRTA
jgi:hypothetical protein